LGLETIVASDSFTITATSGLDTAVQAQAIGNTYAEVHPDVSISPLEQSTVGSPGEVVTFTFTITNSGDYTDTFSLGMDGNYWGTNYPEQTSQIAAGSSDNVQVEVYIPELPALESIIDSDSFTLTATSAWDMDINASASALTEIDVRLNVSLSGFQAGISYIGAPVIYTISITNTGEYSDSYTLTTDGSWPISLSKDFTGLLSPGKSDVVELTVWVPQDMADNATEVTTLNAISDLDANVFAMTQITTTVIWKRIYLPEIQR
jgi:uncharacterized membrane protein